MVLTHIGILPLPFPALGLTSIPGVESSYLERLWPYYHDTIIVNSVGKLNNAHSARGHHCGGGTGYCLRSQLFLCRQSDTNAIEGTMDLPYQGVCETMAPSKFTPTR